MLSDLYSHQIITFKLNKSFTLKTSSFYIIMLHVSDIAAMIRQILYKHERRIINDNDERDLSLTRNVILVYVL